MADVIQAKTKRPTGPLLQRSQTRKGKAGCFIDHLFHLCDFVMRRWAIFSISLLLAIDSRAQQKSPPEPPGDQTPTPSPIAPPPAVIVAPPARPNGPIQKSLVRIT